MKKYLIIAFSLLAVLLGAVSCEKQGAEEEELPTTDAKVYSCSDDANGIKRTISFTDKSTCDIYVKTSKGSLRKRKNYSYSNKIYRFSFTIVIPAKISSSGKDEEYLFHWAEIATPRLIVRISRFNDDGSPGTPKDYYFK